MGNHTLSRPSRNMPRAAVVTAFFVAGLGVLAGLGCSAGQGTYSDRFGPRFALTVTPSSLEVPSGGSGYFTVSAARYGGFTGAINLSFTDSPTGVVASGSIPAGASSGRVMVAVAAGTSVRNPGSLTIQGVSGTLRQTAALGLTILAALPAPSLPTGSLQAAGGAQSSGNLRNASVAGEPVAAVTAKNSTDTVEIHHGYLPVPEPSVP